VVAVVLSRSIDEGLPAFSTTLEPGVSGALLVATATLQLDTGAPQPLPFLVDLPADAAPAPGDVLLAGVQAMGDGGCTEESRAAYASLLDRGTRVVPWPVLLSRDGLPAVRRTLGRMAGPGIGLAVDLPVWLGDPAAADALVGLARSVGWLDGKGRRSVRSLDVWGWSPEVARSPAARALLSRVLSGLLPRAAGDTVGRKRPV